MKEVERKDNIIDFTTGSPAKNILRFFWPMLLTSMLQQVYNFVDIMIVGKGLGDHAVAAVGNMGSLFFLIVGFSIGLSNGFGVLIAQSFGAKDIKLLRKRVAATVVLGILLSILITIFSLLFLPKALVILQTDQILMDDCLRYGYVIFGGLFSAIAYNIAASILRALGDSKTPLYAIIVSSILNLSLDSFFILVVHTGVEGAAIATIISQIVSGIFCIIKISRIDMLKLSRKDFHNENVIYMDLFKNGLPMAFMNSITAIGCMVVQGFVNGHGVDYTTAYAACSKYINLFINPAATAGGAMGAYTSQNYGAKEYDRIKKGLKVCLTIAFVTYVLLGTLMTFFPRFLADILLDGEESIRLACQFLPICGMTMIFVDFLFVFRNGVQGMGNPILPMWSGVLEMFLRIAVIALLIGPFGFKACAFAEVSAWIGAFIMNYIGFVMGFKDRKKVHFSPFRSQDLILRRKVKV
ncbi:MAG: MATE family efflux transporter [Eubacterium sp.]|nr:MATE family efflux transporter [Eubacterium sp.]